MSIKINRVIRREITGTYFAEMIRWKQNRLDIGGLITSNHIEI